jgi:hypothetical protein
MYERLSPAIGTLWPAFSARHLGRLHRRTKTSGQDVLQRDHMRTIRSSRMSFFQRRRPVDDERERQRNSLLHLRIDEKSLAVC